MIHIVAAIFGLAVVAACYCALSDVWHVFGWRGVALLTGCILVAIGAVTVLVGTGL